MYRGAILSLLLKKHGCPLSAKDIERVVKLTEGYTCSDVTNLAKVSYSVKVLVSLQVPAC
jgi:hypothetical protein